MQNAQEPRLTLFEQANGPPLRRNPRCGWLDEEDSRVTGQWAQPDLWGIYRQLTSDQPVE